MKEFVVYTLARLGLFVVAWVLIVLGYVLVVGDTTAVPMLWPFLAAVVVSSIASVYLLRRQREQFAAVVERRASAASRRFEASRSKEDHPED